jgi:hypothetical protein
MMNPPRHRHRYRRLAAWLAVAVVSHTSDVYAKAPAACQLNLSQPTVDYGRVHRTALPLDGGQPSLGTRQLTLTLHCRETTVPELAYRAPAADADHFVLDGPAPGRYALRLRDAVFDGRSVQLGHAASADSSLPQATAQLPWRPGDRLVPMRDGVALAGQTLSLQLEVEATLGAAATRVVDTADWQATGVIEAATAVGELSLAARVVPAACTLTLSNQGEVQLGRIPAQRLHRVRATALPPQQLSLQVVCDAPARFALRVQDDRPGTAIEDDAEYFGLGRDASGHRVGHYRLGIDPASFRADDASVPQMTASVGSGTDWSTSREGPAWIRAGQLMGFAREPGTTMGPSAWQRLHGTLSVESTIAPADGLDLRGDVPIDGHATLEVIYL